MIGRLEKPENWLYFNGRPTTDFGVYISGSGTFSSAEREYETIKVPGRSGDLIIDKGTYKNINVSYPGWIAENMDMNLSAFKNHLLSSKGYCRLEDTYHPEEYRMATFTGSFDADVALLNFSQFNITFNCKPQRYLKSGEGTFSITKSENFFNPTSYEASSIFKVYGNGTFTISDATGLVYSVTVASNPYAFITIDTEMFECLGGNGTANANNYVSMPNGFPKLLPGANTFTLTGSITKLEIIPRWWIL